LLRAARRAQIENPLQLTQQEVEERLHGCIQELFKLKQQAPELRRKHLRWRLSLARRRGDEDTEREIERISKMEEVVANARLIDESQLDLSKALVLSTVKIKNQANGMVMKYTLVAESEADLKSGKISVTSPIGKGLLGKSVGEVAEIIVPNGVLKFDVLEITRD
jgi:transcription elongation GreA/GreB family factor